MICLKKDPVKVQKAMSEPSFLQAGTHAVIYHSINYTFGNITNSNVVDYSALLSEGKQIGIGIYFLKVTAFFYSTCNHLQCQLTLREKG